LEIRARIYGKKITFAPNKYTYYLKLLIYIASLILSMLPATLSAQDYDAEYAHISDSLKSVIDSDTTQGSTRLKAYNELLSQMCDYGVCSDSAMIYATPALELGYSIGDTATIIDITSCIAWIYSYEDDKICFDYMFKAMNMADEYGDPEWICKCNQWLGIFFLNYDMFDKSLDYLNKELEIATDIMDTTLLIHAYNSIAIAYYNLRMYGTSYEYYHKVLELAKKHKDHKQSKLSWYQEQLIETKFQMAKSVDEKYQLVFELEDCMKRYLSENNDVSNELELMLDDLQETYDKLHDKDKKTRVLKAIKYWIDYIDNIDYNQVDEEILDANRLEYYIAIHDKDKAKKTANTLKENLLHSNYNNPSEYKSLSKYYRYINDWKKALEYHELETKESRYLFNADLVVKNELRDIDQDYLAKQKAADDAKHERDRIFEAEKAFMRKIQKWMSAIVALVAGVIVILILNRKTAQKQSALLIQQTEEIMSANEELNSCKEEVMVHRDEIISQTQELSQQRNELSVINKHLLWSINYAERIQRAVVPNEADVRKLFGEAFVFWRPRDIVSGDFYWIYETGKYKYLATADCTGHGVPGALISILGTSYLNDIAPIMDNISTGGILDIMREKISEAVTKSTTSVDDGIDMCIYRISKDHKTMQYSGAKRPLIMLRDNEITTIKADRMSICYDKLGIYNGKFTTHDILLRSGDTFYTFSDGLEDQIGGSDNRKLTSRKLYAILFGMYRQGMEAQRKALNETMDEWIQGQKQMDDMLMIGVRV